ncbi:MAG: hypothetical protein LBS85_04350, partial [Clostridiales Family XIII bacterium]|nr:hypothetical protein [Clostridiales Family XIII bacterium]
MARLGAAETVKTENGSRSRYILLSALSVAGFAIAILVNRLFPQIADVEIEPYPVGGGYELDLNVGNLRKQPV